jgi:hypothetical protein
MRTDDIRHAILETDVSKVLDSCGFWTHAATYHETMPQEMVKHLQRIDTPSALYLRARADRLALHKTLPICYEYECKTRHPRTKSCNWAIEALPLAHHILKASLGVQILYCYRDVECGIDAGFWCDALPRIDCLMLTDRSDLALDAYLKSVFSEKWLGYQPAINYSSASRGSGDPFILIHEAVVRTLPHWNMQIAGTLPVPEVATA